MKRTRLPKYFISTNNLVVQVTISVLFAIAFLSVYVPLSNSRTSWFSLQDESRLIYTVVFIITSTIFLIISRVIMFYLSKRLIKFTYLIYIIWIMAEIAIIGTFHAFISLRIMHIAGFTPSLIIGKSILITFIALGFPFIVTDLSFALIDSRRVLNIAKRVIKANIANQKASTASTDNIVTDTPDIINFNDYNGTPKFTVKLEDIYYIKAEGNYVNVFYKNKNTINSFTLRNKIQAIEDSLAGTPLMRCHRTYIVNSNNIKLLRNEAEGYVIDFNETGLDPVPVSKTYSENIVKRFTKK